MVYNVFGLRHEIPVYDVPPGAFGHKYKKVRPLVAADPPKLSFTAIQLAHGIVKADCYKRDRFEALQVLYFLVQHHGVFEWNSSQLRLKQGARKRYFDFVQSTLAGRVGNGLTILFANSLKHPYQSHFVTFIDRNPPQGGVPLPKQAPDFVCGDAQNLTIFESKGGFPRPNNLADVSGDLQSGLNQIGTWPNILNINKSYACASYIREIGDTHAEGSLLAYVDPQGDEVLPTFQFTPTDLLRENYASWFVAMGLPDVAARLRGGTAAEAKPHKFLVYQLDTSQDARGDIAFPHDDVPDHQLREALGEAFVIPRFGIELGALNGIKALEDGEILPVYFHELGIETVSLSDAEGESYSLFPDGSYLGAIPRNLLAQGREIEVII